MKFVSTMLWLLGAALLVGCSSTVEHTFDITVKNNTGGPITIWLTKDGGPLEPGWRSPEQVAMQSLADEERISGVVIPDGKTASTPPVVGRFQPGRYAWLRIYDGQYKFSELLAISPKSALRLDQPLYPGRNVLNVRKAARRLVVEPETPLPALASPHAQQPAK